MDLMTLDRDNQEREQEIQVFCAWCLSKEKVNGEWQVVSKDVAIALRNVSSHGICTDCYKKVKEAA